MKNLTRSIKPLAFVLLTALLGAGSPARPEDAVPKLWQLMYRQDLVFIRQAIHDHYIYARVPGGSAWDRLIAAADRQATADSEKVNDFAGYRWALERYADSFVDAHLRVHLDLKLAHVGWPRFLVRYQSGRYVVVESSAPKVPVDAAITSCDGRPIEALVAERAPPLGSAAGGEDGSALLESTRDAMARRLFVDEKDPFVSLPKRCRIGADDVDLAWAQIDADAFGRLNAPHDLMRDPTTQISSFGTNSARVRMSTFAPHTPEEAQQFHAVIDAAPMLRDKDIVVLDVRGNPGGTYNWLVAFLEAFYGTDYADHYATARLKITPVFVDPPDLSSSKPQEHAAAAQAATPLDPFNTPPDKAVDNLLTGFVPRPAAGGATVYAATLGALPDAARRRPPPNPVKARVYVLTDYNCASACIAFVDELRRFPGVVQVGRETGVDSRSGTPRNYDLPSGNGGLYLPSMVREGRERGDNIPWRPDIRFDGDIADTAAILTWIQTLPPQRPRKAP